MHSGYIYFTLIEFKLFINQIIKIENLTLVFFVDKNMSGSYRKIVNSLKSENKKKIFSFTSILTMKKNLNCSILQILEFLIFKLNGNHNTIHLQIGFMNILILKFLFISIEHPPTIELRNKYKVCEFFKLDDPPSIQKSIIEIKNNYLKFQEEVKKNLRITLFGKNESQKLINFYKNL